MRRLLIGGKDFHNFHSTRKINSRRGHGKLEGRGGEENECVKGELVVMCEEVLFIEKMCANKRTWKEVVCNK
jgi:hypothetical protein